MNANQFLQTQRQFAAHLRDPQRTPAPAGIEDRRMGIYRDLFWRNIEGFIANGFPVLRSILDEQRWQWLVRRFYADHQCHSGYFMDIPEQFLLWLNDTPSIGEGYPPFIRELAYYEWLELALTFSTDECPPASVQRDFFAGRPQLSPLSALYGGHWPVHQIGPQYLPDAPLPQPVWLLVWRDRADAVHFMEMSAPAARLIQLMQEQAGAHLTGAGLLAQLAAELAQPAESLRPLLQPLLAELLEKDIIARIDQSGSE